MPDELYLDPFTRKHQGRHNAFLVRTNPAHVELCRSEILARNIRREAVRRDEAQPWEAVGV